MFLFPMVLASDCCLGVILPNRDSFYLQNHPFQIHPVYIPLGHFAFREQFPIDIFQSIPTFVFQTWICFYSLFFPENMVLPETPSFF